MQALRPLVRPAPTRILLAAIVGSLVAVAALAGSMAGSAASGNDNRLAASLASSAPTGSSALSNGASVDAKVVKQVAAHGQTTFWVVLREHADLARTRDACVTERALRLQLIDVHGGPQSAAAESVAPQRHVPFKSFWILNAVRVTAGSSVLHSLAARPEVAKILPDVDFRVPKVTPGQGGATPGTVEWGLTNINAPQVWTNFNDRGEGIVVGNIDTGVLYTHNALVMKYRGRNGNGTFDHNYNWNDPTGVCGSLTPCDNNGHGTHTMGTMVGDDGDPGPNQVGVAPHAKWIASKGCASNSCDTAALLASGQWMLAPTEHERAEPGSEPAAGHRQQLVGQLERRRHLLPGDRAVLDQLGHLPRLFERQRGPRLWHRGLAGELCGELRRRRLRHQQRDRELLESRPVASRWDHQAEHRRAGRKRSLVVQQRVVHRAQRHVDGRAPSRGGGRAHLVGRSGIQAKHRRDQGGAQPDRDRYRRHMRRDDREQQLVR